MRPLMNSALFKYFFLMLFALLVVAPGASSVAAVLAARVAQAGSPPRRNHALSCSLPSEQPATAALDVAHASRRAGLVQAEDSADEVSAAAVQDNRASLPAQLAVSEPAAAAHRCAGSG